MNMNLSNAMDWPFQALPQHLLAYKMRVKVWIKSLASLENELSPAVHCRHHPERMNFTSSTLQTSSFFRRERLDLFLMWHRTQIKNHPAASI